MLDPDAPEDAASTRWWANVGGKSSKTEKISIAATSKAAVKSTPGVVSSLVGQDGAGEQLALTNVSSTTPASGNGPSLQELVGVMNGQAPAAVPKGKAKAKAKAKAAVTKDLPKTPEERRDAIRTLSSLRFFFFRKGTPV